MLESYSVRNGGVILVSFLIFAFIYASHRRLQSGKGNEWSIRLVTMIHAGVVTTLAYSSCFLIGPWPFTEPGLESNTFNLAIISISLGYFILDYLWCLRFGSEEIVMHVHHWFSLVYLSWGLYSHVSGAEIVGVIFGSEVTNPMLQLRWMLRQSGKYETIIGRINDILFATAFISIRCVVGSYFLYCVLSHPKPTIAVKAGGVMFYGISCVFGYQVISFSQRKITAWRRYGFINPTTPASPSQQAAGPQQRNTDRVNSKKEK